MVRFKFYKSLQECENEQLRTYRKYPKIIKQWSSWRNIHHLFVIQGNAKRLAQCFKVFHGLWHVLSLVHESWVFPKSLHTEQSPLQPSFHKGRKRSLRWRDIQTFHMLIHLDLCWFPIKAFMSKALDVASLSRCAAKAPAGGFPSNGHVKESAAGDLRSHIGLKQQ